MARLSIAVLCLYLGFLSKVNSQSCVNDTIISDIIFVIDDSKSIDAFEYSQYEDIIVRTIQHVQINCPEAWIGVVHYGGANGREMNIEYNLAPNQVINNVNRQFCLSSNCSQGGDDLNAAMENIVSNFQNNNLNRNPNNNLSLVIFTDAANESPSIDCDNNINCSQIAPFTGIDVLKSDPYNADVVVAGFTAQAASDKLAIYASPGGSFNVGSLSAECSTAVDGCQLPRKYIQSEFSSSVHLTASEIASHIDCENKIVQPITISAGPDQSICSNLNQSTNIAATVSAGTGPFTYIWDQGLGNGQSHTVKPSSSTTYTVTVTDSNNCQVTDQVRVNVEFCNLCTANAGTPKELKETCLINGRATIVNEQNAGISKPSGYEIVYILTDADLTIVDYKINSGSFLIRNTGLYRIHTLIAEVSNRRSDNYFDLRLITLNLSNLFVIANCIVDHNICADFDYAGRVHLILDPSERMCLTFENSINLCSDGRDNDSDGLVDCKDPDCLGLTVCSESSAVACNDLYDNDEDGLVDCYDPDCWEFKRCFEQEENCNDGIDNDGDGLIDCQDSSCFDSKECMEDSPFTCVDGIDNDRDGLIDCQEAACQKFIVCAEYDVAACSDGLDNDYDGLIDCADMDCQMLLSNICAASESTLNYCNDGIDNDADGLVDCQDPDCGYVSLASLENQLNNLIRVTDASCPFNNNGKIELTGGLINSNYQYKVNGIIQTSTSYTDLVPGEYDISISTLTQCELFTNLIITGADCTEKCSDGIDNDGDGLIDCADADCGMTEFLGKFSYTNPQCPLQNNGTISISGQNPAFSYTYSINGGQNYQQNASFSNLEPGTYNVRVKSNDGCIYSEEVSLTSIICIEICNNNFDDDGDGFTDCEDFDCGVLGIEQNISITTATCPELIDGTITIGGQRDNVIYNYSIDNGDHFVPTDSFGALSPGEYNLLIRTSDLCDFTAVLTVEADDCTEKCSDGIDNDGDGFTDCEDTDCGITAIANNITIIPPTCPELTDGMIRIGGRVDGVEYSYSLNGGETYQTEPLFTELSVGEYLLEVITSGGCEYITNLVIEDIDCTELCSDGLDNDGDGLVDCDDSDCGVTGFDQQIATTTPSCPSLSDGTITIGGQSNGFDYLYSIDNGLSFDTIPIIRDLSPGDYEVIIRSEEGCDHFSLITVPTFDCVEICDNGIDDDGNGLTDCEDPACGALNFEGNISTVSVTCPFIVDGQIIIEGQTEGIDYLYSITGGDEFVAENSFTELPLGSYDIAIITSSGCEYSTFVSIASEACIEICDDGLDNDHDGFIDCEDEDCGILSIGENITVFEPSCPDKNNGSIVIGGQISGVSYSYSKNGGNTFQSDSLFTNISSGRYVIIVRSSGGCEYLTELIIDELDCSEQCNDGIDNDGDGFTDCADSDCGMLGFDEGIMVGQVSCPSQNDGTIIIGGQSAGHVYEYSINGGVSYDSLSVFSGLTSGFYGIVIRSINGCTYLTEVHIDELDCSEQCNDGIDNDGDGFTDCADSDCGMLGFDEGIMVGQVSCPSQNDGTIIIGGQSAGHVYEYSINGGVSYDSLSVFSGLTPGSYGIVIRSINGCEYHTELVIDELDCSEQCNDGIDNDGDGFTDCADSDCGMIGFAEGIQVDQVSCPSQNDGTIIIGGQSAGHVYEYSINGGVNYDSLSVFSGLTPGSYGIVIRSINGCEYHTELIIDELDCSEQCNDGIDNDGDGFTDCADSDCGMLGFVEGIQVEQVSCPTQSDGTIIIGGQSAGNVYEYSIDGGVNYDSLSVFSGLTPSSYTIVIRSMNGCEYHTELVIDERDCSEQCNDGIDNDGDGFTDCADSDCGMLGFEQGILTEQVSCPSQSDGMITITGQAAGHAYEYSIDGGLSYDSLSVFSGLTPGSYPIVIRSINGCEYYTVLVIEELDCSEKCNDGIDNDGDGFTDCADSDCGMIGFEQGILTEQVSCPTQSDGMIIITGQASGHAYEYSIDGGMSYDSLSVFNGLTPDSYAIVIRSINGCEYHTVLVIDELDCSEQCNDGIDNDGDGFSDCADSDCGMIGFAAGIQAEQVSCPSQSDGTIIITGQSAGHVYEYSIDGGMSYDSLSVFNGLTPGSYAIVIRSINGCEYHTVLVIEELDCSEKCNDGIDNDGDGFTDCADSDCGMMGFEQGILTEQISCPTQSDGMIIITGQSAGHTYEYSIDGGVSYDSLSVFSGLSPGSYPIVIRSINGCEYHTVLVIEELDCSEQCNDGIDNDGDGFTDCADSDCGMMGFAEGIQAEQVSCPTQSDGMIIITGQSAGHVYEYSIDGGMSYDSLSVFNGLTPGSYAIVIRSINGCEYHTVLVIDELDCSEQCNDGIDNDGDGFTDCADSDCGMLGFVEGITIENSTCPNNNSGRILIKGQQQGNTYTYSINNGLDFYADSLFLNLVPKEYELVVKSENGCEFSTIAVVEGEECIENCIDGVDNDGDGLIDCDDPECGVTGFDGSILTINPTCDNLKGGIIEVFGQHQGDFYLYDINTGSGLQVSSRFTNLSAGTYMLEIQNIVCDYSTEIVLEAPDCPEICDNGIDDDGDSLIDCKDPDCGLFDTTPPIVVHATCPDNDNGAIIYYGLSETLQFSLDNINYQELALFDSVAAGDYTFYLRNNQGCTDSMSITVEAENCDENTVAAFISSVEIDIKANLQGAYDTEKGEMTTELNKLGYLPGQKPATFFGEAADAGQPYNQAPWFYEGQEGLSNSNNGKSNNALYSDDVVDWILISLRTDVTKSTEVWRGTGLVHSDGFIEMISALPKDILGEKEYFLVIEHRNHLPIMTPYGVSFKGNKLSFDFTKQDSYKSIFGVGQIKMDNGKYAMIAGNGDLITELSSHIDINVRDLNSWLQQNGANSSYFLEDFDLNGDINIKDRIIWEKNNGLFSSMPNR